MATRQEPGARRPEAWPELAPEDRLSNYVDYAQVMPTYPQMTAEQGEAHLKEMLDYLFYFLNTSDALLDEREFQDWRWHLDPHDYLIHELDTSLHELGEQALAAWTTDLPDPQPVHMVNDGLRRYYTPQMRRDLHRRARKLERRRPGGIVGARAGAVALAAEDPAINPLMVGLLVESLRRDLLQAVSELPERELWAWEERDQRLDHWLEALRQASAEHPAEEAVRRLQRAGQKALPLVVHLCGDIEVTCNCEDYPFVAGLQVAAAIPAFESLWLLRRAIIACPILNDWCAEQLAANMPGLACAYFGYLLSSPQPPEARLAASGLGTVVAARCPDAFDLAVASLGYTVEDNTATETVQVAAWKALLALGDPAAIPVLRAYLADAEASRPARDQLVVALEAGEHRDWREAILGQPVLQA